MTTSDSRVGHPGARPELTDGVVLLRAHRECDAPRIVAQCRDPESQRFTPIPRPYGEDDARSFLALVEQGWAAAMEGDDTAQRHWAIAAADDPGRYCGSIDLSPRLGGMVEVGFALHPDARGRGLVSRALRLLQGYVAAEGLRGIRWLALVGNWPSRRVAWACGFRIGDVTSDALEAWDDAATTRRPADAWQGSWRVGEPTTPQVPWYAAPTLTGSELVLRAWRDEDGAEMPERLDHAAARFLPRIVPTRGTYDAFLADRRDREARGTGVAWAITAADSGALLGGIHLFDISHERRRGNATLGVFVLPAARGRGVFGRALRPVLDHAFTPVEDDSTHAGLGLARVRADADLANVASVRSMLRAGMSWTGWTREERPDDRPGHEGERIDMCGLEVLASDDRAAVAATNTRGATQPATLRDERVVLRAFTEDDAEAVRALMADPEFGPDHTPEPTEFQARTWITRGLAAAYRRAALRWAVCPVTGDAVGPPVGVIRAFRLDDALHTGSAEIGYTLHPSARGRGLAGAAARLLVDHLLAPSAEGGDGLRTVTAVTAPENLASQRVLERAGLRFQGIDPYVVAPTHVGRARTAAPDGAPSAHRWRYLRVASHLPDVPAPAVTGAGLFGSHSTPTEGVGPE